MGIGGGLDAFLSLMGNSDEQASWTPQMNPGGEGGLGGMLFLIDTQPSLESPGDSQSVTQTPAKKKENKVKVNQLSEVSGRVVSTFPRANDSQGKPTIKTSGERVSTSHGVTHFRTRNQKDLQQEWWILQSMERRAGKGIYGGRNKK